METSIDVELPKDFVALDRENTYKNIKENVYPNKKGSHIDKDSYVSCNCTPVNGCDEYCQNRILFMLVVIIVNNTCTCVRKYHGVWDNLLFHIVYKSFFRDVL